MSSVHDSSEGDPARSGGQGEWDRGRLPVAQQAPPRRPPGWPSSLTTATISNRASLTSCR